MSAIPSLCQCNPRLPSYNAKSKFQCGDCDMLNQELFLANHMATRPPPIPPHKRGKPMSRREKTERLRLIHEWKVFMEENKCHAVVEAWLAKQARTQPGLIRSTSYSAAASTKKRELSTKAHEFWLDLREEMSLTAELPKTPTAMSVETWCHFIASNVPGILEKSRFLAHIGEEHYKYYLACKTALENDEPLPTPTGIPGGVTSLYERLFALPSRQSPLLSYVCRKCNSVASSEGLGHSAWVNSYA